MGIKHLTWNSLYLEPACLDRRFGTCTCLVLFLSNYNLKTFRSLIKNYASVIGRGYECWDENPMKGGLCLGHQFSRCPIQPNEEISYEICAQSKDTRWGQRVCENLTNKMWCVSHERPGQITLDSSKHSLNTIHKILEPPSFQVRFNAFRDVLLASFRGPVIFHSARHTRSKAYPPRCCKCSTSDYAYGSWIYIKQRLRRQEQIAIVPSSNYESFLYYGDGTFFGICSANTYLSERSLNML